MFWRLAFALRGLRVGLGVGNPTWSLLTGLGVRRIVGLGEGEGVGRGVGNGVGGNDGFGVALFWTAKTRSSTSSYWPVGQGYAAPLNRITTRTA